MHTDVLVYWDHVNFKKSHATLSGKIDTPNIWTSTVLINQQLASSMPLFINTQQLSAGGEGGMAAHFWMSTFITLLGSLSDLHQNP